MMQRVALAQVPPQAWRNGGGSTQVLLSWPAAAQDAWTLRVSVARVERTGPFSAFPGIHRGFVVLQGAGVRLSLPDGERRLAPGDDPLWFDGEAAPMCTPVDGPTLDLNFMLRRGAGVPRFAAATPGRGIDGPTAWRGLFALQPALLDVDGHTEPVQAGELLWTDAVDASPWTLHPGRSAAAWWLLLEA